MNDVISEKIGSVISGSKRFAILSQEDADDFVFLAREALRHALGKNDLESYSLSDLPQKTKDKWRSILPTETEKIPLSGTAIHIPKNKYKIKEVSCEENDEHFSIIISSHGNGVNPADLHFESKVPKVDSVFCFFEDKNLIENFKKKIILPASEKIIFISKNNTTTAEKINDIIEIIDPELLKLETVSTLLFASLVLETENFAKFSNASTLSLGSKLLEAGVSKETIEEIIKSERDPNFVKLLGRTLARVREDKALSSNWSFLSKEDLKKTNYENQGADIFYQVLKKMKEIAPEKKINLILWQKEDGVRAIIDTDENSELAQKIARQLNIPSSQKYLITDLYPNFSEAELKIREALKSTLLLN